MDACTTPQKLGRRTTPSRSPTPGLHTQRLARESDTRRTNIRCRDTDYCCVKQVNHNKLSWSANGVSVMQNRSKHAETVLLVITSSGQDLASLPEVPAHARQHHVVIDGNFLQFLTVLVNRILRARMHKAKHSSFHTAVGISRPTRPSSSHPSKIVLQS